jgi:hypothetical protein
MILFVFSPIMILNETMNIGYQEVSNMVSLTVHTATYRVIALPFEFIKLMSMGNIFPNIVFNYVTELWMSTWFQLKKFYVISLTLLYDAQKLFDNIQSYEIVEYPPSHSD